MTALSLRERLARAMAGVLDGGWDNIPHDRKQQRRWTGPLGINTPSRDDFLLSADLLIPEILSYLTDHGLAIVPVKATENMRGVGRYEIAFTIDTAPGFGFVANATYDAMVKAAPPAAELLAGTKEKT